MIAMKYNYGALLIAYQNNGVGVNQDNGFAQDPDNITKAAIFAKLKPQAKVTRNELLDLFIKYNLTLRADNEASRAFAAAVKSVEGPEFMVVYEGHFYVIRKLPTRTNKIPVRSTKLSQFESSSEPSEHFMFQPTAQVGAFCLKALEDNPNLKLRVKVIGRPYRRVWGKKSKVNYYDPINSEVTVDESIGS